MRGWFFLFVASVGLTASAPTPAYCASRDRNGPEATYDAAMQLWMTANGITDGSIAVMHEDRLVFAKGYGNRRPNERIGVWSLSKAITAACIATLVQERRIRFDDAIGPLLAPLFEAYGRPVDARVERITIAQLIAHRGGYPRLVGGNRFAPGVAESLRLRSSRDTTQAQLLPSILALHLVREPGSEYEYSNVGYLLLGQIIEAVTGHSYEAECGTRVLARAGIKEPVLEATWGRVAYSAAGWSLSGPEYLAFARLLRPRQTAVLNSGMHRWLMQPEGHWIDDQHRRAYTLGMRLYMIPNQRPTLFHGGSWVWTQADAKDGPIDDVKWTYFVMAGDGTAWFVSFPGKPGDEENKVFSDLEAALWRAKQATTSWPSRDLFPSMNVGAVKSK